MKRKLDDLLSHILENVRFGSKISQNVIDKWFKEYTLTIEDKFTLYNELDLLQIEIIGLPKTGLKSNLLKLYKCIEGEGELSKTILNKWFNQNNIDEDSQKNIINDLKREKFIIIDDVPKKDRVDIDIPEDFLEDTLDSLLEDESFIEEVNLLEDVVDKSRNIEYLTKLHSQDISIRSQSLSNLVEANTRLVWKVVKRYAGLATNGFDENDMYQVGMIGLIKAAEKFDISSGNQFSTYAIWWVRQAITRGIADNANLIRIPVHQWEKMKRLIKIENELWNEFGRPATISELAEEMDEPIAVIEKLRVYISQTKLASLDRPVGEGEDTRLGDLIEDHNPLLPEQEYLRQELRMMIDEVIKTNLTDKEAEVLYHRFGFGSDGVMTLESVGKIFDVTRERIRQIESKALMQLGRPKISNLLKEYLYEH